MQSRKLKLIYFIFYFAFATWRVFYNIFLEENNFTGFQVGVINALFQATVFVIVPFWGIIADKRGIRPTLRIAVLVSGVLLLFLGNILNFWNLLLYIFVLTIFYHPVGPLVDAFTVQFIRNKPNENYGSYRLWASLGWAVSALIGGYVLLHYNLKVIFPVSGILLLSVLLFLRTAKGKSKVYKPQFQKISIKELAGNKNLLVFLIILFLYGIVSSPINAYLNLYFIDLGASNSVIGLAYTIQAVSELPFFILGDRLLKRIGAVKVILISMLLMVIRLFIYSLFPDINIALLICALQGITFSFLIVGVVDYLHKQLPAGRDATAQSLLWGLYFGIGQMVGNLIIGILKDGHGMIGVFNIFAYLTLAVFLFTAVDFALQIRWKR